MGNSMEFTQKIENRTFIWSSNFISGYLPQENINTNLNNICTLMGCPDSSAGKESACNAGDFGSISELGRFPGEGIGYPLQYWAFLVAQLVKNPPAMQVTWVWSLGWEDPLEKGKATHSSILVWRISWTIYHGITKSWTCLSDFHFTSSSWKCGGHISWRQ